MFGKLKSMFGKKKSQPVQPGMPAQDQGMNSTTVPGSATQGQDVLGAPTSNPTPPPVQPPQDQQPPMGPPQNPLM